LWRSGDLEGAALNLGTELIGAVVTYALFELIIEAMERREAQRKAVETRHRNQLVARMGSRMRSAAVQAAAELRARGWLQLGSLRNAPLDSANLAGSDLQDAVLTGASLASANLAGALLVDANLRGANLGASNLEGANLGAVCLQQANLARSNLENTNLNYANLEGASLVLSCLQGASLWGANLSGADLRRSSLTAEQAAQARSLAGATLPDGTTLSDDNWEAEFEEWRSLD
jgi:hypothetical protein